MSDIIESATSPIETDLQGENPDDVLVLLPGYRRDLKIPDTAWAQKHMLAHFLQSRATSLILPPKVDLRMQAEIALRKLEISTWKERLEKSISHLQTRHEEDLRKQKDYYESLIRDVQKFRQSEFRLVLYGSIAIGVAVLCISLIARIWE